MASIKVKQHDIQDFGAACLASIGNHYEVNLPIARIRQYANTILVMKNGTIVETGNHSDLLQQKGKYFDLWNKQSLV